MPTFEIVSGLDLCGKDWTLLQAFTDDGICLYYASGFQRLRKTQSESVQGKVNALSRECGNPE